jgi:phosphatidylglycerophosphatase A
LLVAGIPLCGRTARALGVHDHGAIVWDEVAAMPVALVTAERDLVLVLVGFGLFRLFDIWKPWPIRWADQHVHGGFGIMLDDVLAALLAAAGLASFRYLFYL